MNQLNKQLFSQTNMTLDKLDKFLASPFYKHWSSFLRQGVNEHGERVSRIDLWTLIFLRSERTVRSLVTADETLELFSWD